MDDTLTHLPVITQAIHGVEIAVAEADENLMLAHVPGADRVPAFLSKGLVDGLVIKTPLLGNWRKCATRELIEAVEKKEAVHVEGVPVEAAALQELLEADEDDPNDLAALDAIWEEEVVTFGPDASSNDECPKVAEMLTRMGADPSRPDAH